MANIITKTIISTVVMAVICLFVIAFGYFIGTANATPKPYNEVKQPSEIKNDEQIYLEYISGTEYVLPKDHQGSTILTLRDSKRNFINTTCFLVILYPDRTVYFPETEMYIDFVYGSYYYHWVVPDDKLGVYEQNVRCIVKNKNITQAKAFHVSNMTNILLESNNKLNDTATLILQTLNCSNPDYTAMCDYLRSIESKVGNTSNYSTTIILNNLSSMVNNLISINQTLSDNFKIYYQVFAPDCISGSFWLFSAFVTNIEYEPLPFLNCTLVTDVFGTETIPYNFTTQRYSVLHPCSPNGINNWDLNCVKT